MAIRLANSPEGHENQTGLSSFEHSRLDRLWSGVRGEGAVGLVT